MALALGLPILGVLIGLVIVLIVYLSHARRSAKVTISKQGKDKDAKDLEAAVEGQEEEEKMPATKVGYRVGGKAGESVPPLIEVQMETKAVQKEKQEAFHRSQVLLYWTHPCIHAIPAFRFTVSTSASRSRLPSCCKRD